MGKFIIAAVVVSIVVAFVVAVGECAILTAYAEKELQQAHNLAFRRFKGAAAAFLMRRVVSLYDWSQNTLRFVIRDGNEAYR